MTLTRRIFAWVIRGTMAGMLLGWIAPAKALSAGCKCDDDGSGNYKCNAAQTKCEAGTEICDLMCT